MVRRHPPPLRRLRPRDPRRRPFAPARHLRPPQPTGARERRCPPPHRRRRRPRHPPRRIHATDRGKGGISGGREVGISGTTTTPVPRTPDIPNSRAPDIPTSRHPAVHRRHRERRHHPSPPGGLPCSRSGASPVFAFRGSRSPRRGKARVEERARATAGSYSCPSFRRGSRSSGIRGDRISGTARTAVPSRLPDFPTSRHPNSRPPAAAQPPRPPRNTGMTSPSSPSRARDGAFAPSPPPQGAPAFAPG